MQETARRRLSCSLLLLCLFPLGGHAWTSSFFQTSRKLLVSYAYHDGRAEARENLQFFLRVGVARRPPNPSEVVYGFVINGHNCTVPLPTNRSDVFVLRRENRGYDYGQHLALLQHLVHARQRSNKHAGSWEARLRGSFAPAAHVEAHEAGPRLLDVLDFTHFFFLNCGVRGPFLPVYWPRALHWSSAYTELIDTTVKIVGGSIVCLHFPDGCVKRDPTCAGPKGEDEDGHRDGAAQPTRIPFAYSYSVCARAVHLAARLLATRRTPPLLLSPSHASVRPRLPFSSPPLPPPSRCL